MVMRWNILMEGVSVLDSSRPSRWLASGCLLESLIEKSVRVQVARLK